MAEVSAGSRLSKAVHGRYELPPDPDYVAGLIADLRSRYSREGLMEF